jgi:dipeptidyl aminopeptidase/acylaminoacyl peptidase
MPDRIHARPLHVAIMTLLTATLCGCAAASPSPTPVDVSLPQAPSTLRSIIEAEAEHPVFELVQETTDFDGDHADVVSYVSGGLEVRAVIRRPPSGAADSPAIVFVHGAVDPDQYSGLTEYDDVIDHLVASGYTVVAPDLRNHGESDDDPAWETDMDVGSTLDVVNAALATAADPLVDADRVAIVGHSLGGAVAVKAAVVAPDSARAVAALAPSHVEPWEDVKHYMAGTPLYDAIVGAHGDPDESPEFWSDVSALTFVDRMTAPLLVVHGTHDDIVPIGWSRFLNAQWTEAGRDVTLVELDEVDHSMGDVAAVTSLITDFLAETMP